MSSKMLKIGFLENRLNIRGTSVAMFHYAHYNETMLGNKSVIITRDLKRTNMIDTSQEVYNRFINRFQVLYYENKEDIDRIVAEQQLDILYIIKAGSPSDGLTNFKCKTIIHCVFETREPHGNHYVTISEFVNNIHGTKLTVLPHIVEVHETNKTLRQKLDIPVEATVFGTYSGENQFDIYYINSVIAHILTNNINNIYFIFLGIKPFCNVSDKHIIFLPSTTDMKYKRKFINTCDAMLYGRAGGETFGLSCGEFSICNKPVICHTPEHSHFHLDVLGNDAILHHNYDELLEILMNWSRFNKDVSHNGYKKYTPIYVMAIFQTLLS